MNIDEFDLNLLRVLEALLNEGSVTRASLRMISQSLSGPQPFDPATAQATTR